jgi:hypothetical protein
LRELLVDTTCRQQYGGASLVMPSFCTRALPPRGMGHVGTSQLRYVPEDSYLPSYLFLFMSLLRQPPIAPRGTAGKVGLQNWPHEPAGWGRLPSAANLALLALWISLQGPVKCNLPYPLPATGPYGKENTEICLADFGDGENANPPLPASAPYVSAEWRHPSSRKWMR